MLKASKIPLFNSSSPVQLDHSVKAHSQEVCFHAEFFLLFVSFQQ